MLREVQVKDGATVGALVRGEARGARFVNGVAADGDTKVHGGDRVWADAAAPIARSPAVVGSFPEPFLHGIDGKRLPVRIECADARGAACRQVADRLAAYDIPAARGGLQTARAPETLRVLVGPWSALRLDPAVNALERGPRASGVYARIAQRRALASPCSTRRAHDAHARRRQRPRGRDEAPGRPADVGRDRHRRRRRRVGRSGLRGGHAGASLRPRRQPRPPVALPDAGLTGAARDRVGSAAS